MLTLAACANQGGADLPSATPAIADVHECIQAEQSVDAFFAAFKSLDLAKANSLVYVEDESAGASAFSLIPFYDETLPRLEFAVKNSRLYYKDGDPAQRAIMIVQMRYVDSSAFYTLVSDAYEKQVNAGQNPDFDMLFDSMYKDYPDKFKSFTETLLAVECKQDSAGAWKVIVDEDKDIYNVLTGNAPNYCL